MQPLVLLGEVAAFSAVLCGLHRLRGRVGLAPLFATLGLFEAFLFVAGKSSPPVKALLFFAPPANVAYALFLPLLLSTIVLVYVLEGTRTARHLLAALVVLYVLHGVIDAVVMHHATHPPPGTPYLGDSDVVWYSLPSRIASLVAMVVDFVVVIVGYQFLLNRLPRAPLFVPLFLATLLALVSDSLVYSLARGRLFSWDNVMLLEKLQVGIAAALPVSLYLYDQLRRNREDVRRGVLERGALEIVDLRRRVHEAERKLKEQRARYAYIKDTFGRYVSPEVVEAILADPSRVELGGELRRVTVLFADVRGYSTLSEALPPTEVIRILNCYFQRVSEVVLRRGGMINEFEGDGVLAIFGAPLDLPDHAEAAVRAGSELLAAAEQLNVEWEEDGTLLRWRAAGLDEFSIRVGIHSGLVVAGNVGSRERIKYAVIGDTVNTASRVEGLNKPLGTSLLFTEATHRELVKRGVTLPSEFLGEHAVKGRTELVGVHTVARLAPASERLPDAAAGG